MIFDPHDGVFFLFLHTYIYIFFLFLREQCEISSGSKSKHSLSAHHFFFSVLCSLCHCSPEESLCMTSLLWAHASSRLGNFHFLNTHLHAFRLSFLLFYRLCFSFISSCSFVCFFLAQVFTLHLLELNLIPSMQSLHSTSLWFYTNPFACRYTTLRSTLPVFDDLGLLVLVLSLSWSVVSIFLIFAFCVFIWSFLATPLICLSQWKFHQLLHALPVRLPVLTPPRYYTPFWESRFVSTIIPYSFRSVNFGGPLPPIDLIYISVPLLPFLPRLSKVLIESKYHHQFSYFLLDASLFPQYLVYSSRLVLVFIHVKASPPILYHIFCPHILITNILCSVSLFFISSLYFIITFTLSSFSLSSIFIFFFLFHIPKPLSECPIAGSLELVLFDPFSVRFVD